MMTPKTPTIVSLIVSFIMSHRSIILTEEWEKEMVSFSNIKPQNEISYEKLFQKE